MARPILMPQVGQDLTEGKIVALNVKIGDKVKKGDIVAAVESEKATFDVEAFETGTVLEMRHKVGDVATVLQPLMMVGDEGEVLAGAEQVSAAGAELIKPAAAQSRPAQSRQPNVKAGSSPLARRLAGEAGLALAGVLGSGPGGAVVKKDVDALRRSAPAGSGSLPFAGLSAANASAGGALRTLQAGTGDPVVFIHGFGADLSAWRPLVLHLGLSNPVLALDLCAHGANAHVQADDFETLTRAARNAIARSGIERLHLAGHSLGAAVAASIAGGGDLDVRSLVLISPAGLGPTINGDFVSGFLSSNSEAALKVWLSLLVHNPARLPGALVRATLEGRTESAMVENQTRLAAGLFSGNTQLFSVRDALERYTGPCRVIAGHDDCIIPADYTKTLPGHVGLHVVAHVGHLPQLEAASLVARLVTETVRSAG
jgi:pimeloyl-ACP methyl ester carboxylesterase